MLKLVGELCDPLPTIAAIDLEGFARSEEPGEARLTEYGFVECREPDGPGLGDFGYRPLGRTPGGTHVLEAYYAGGGIGVFEYLIFVRFETDRVLEGGKLRHRVLMKSVGGLFLGDREDPLVQVIGNRVRVGPSRGWMRSWTEAFVIDVD